MEIMDVSWPKDLKGVDSSKGDDEDAESSDGCNSTSDSYSSNSS